DGIRDFHVTGVQTCALPIWPDGLTLLEDWLRSYRAEELFDENGTLMPELRELAPTGTRRIGANPHSNGGALMRQLRMPDFHDYRSEERRVGEEVRRREWAAV